MVFLLFFNVKIGHIGALNCCIHFHLNILQKKKLYTDHISYIGYVIGYGFVCLLQNKRFVSVMVSQTPRIYYL